MRDFRTMTELAAQEIRKSILNGDLVPGTRLIPAKLEEEMELSRVSIREAIRELVGSGLVDTTTHKGAFVAEPLAMSEIKDIFKFRYQVEGRAAYLGTKHIMEDDITRLEELILGVEKEMPDSQEGFFVNYEIHMTLYRATGWKYLCKMIERIYDQVIACRGSLYRQLREIAPKELKKRGGFLPFHQDHLQILAAVKSRDAVRARAMTVVNLKRGLANAIELSKMIPKV